MHRTKIIATIGPSSDSKEMISKLIESGVNIFRLNMSHETHVNGAEAIKAIREINSNIAILVDLQGPRIRTGRLKGKTAKLQANNDFIITTKQVDGNDAMVSTDYEGLPKEIKIGQKILLDNGLIELRVIRVSDSDVYCKIFSGGILGEHKGINIPGVSIFKKALTEKDKKDIEFAVKENIDYIGLSFIKNSDDVLEAKKMITDLGSNIPVIAKIENPEALLKLDSIINVSDAVMVARGDLGVELPPEDVPMTQKAIIKKCSKMGKPVIVASQMLEFMVENSRPTRAETTDIANAIIDGADALMLSEESASGKYPIESVEMMKRIIEKVEEEGCINNNLDEIDIKQNISFAVSHAAAHMCEDLNAKAIITFTSSGSTALMVSKCRTKSPIFAGITKDEIARKVSLYWGVQAIKMKEFYNTDEMVQNIQKAIIDQNLIKKDDLVIITAGVPVGIPGTTNLIKVHKIF